VQVFGGRDARTILHPAIIAKQLRSHDSTLGYYRKISRKIFMVSGTLSDA